MEELDRVPSLERDIVLWYSPYGLVANQPEVLLETFAGPSMWIRSDRSPSKVSLAVALPLDQPQSVFGVALKLEEVTICFRAAGAQIAGTDLSYRATREEHTLYTDEFVHSSPTPSCYHVAPPAPTVIAGSIHVALDVEFYNDPTTAVHLYSVRARLGT